MSPTSLDVRPLLPRQQEPVTAPVGPVLILGGAGTGKTHCVAARIAVLVKRDERPLGMTLLTHTGGASEYVTQKVQEFLVGLDDTFLGFFVGTPTQFALELLRYGGMAALGRSSDFTVWAGSHAEQFVADLLLEANRKNRWQLLVKARSILRWHRLNRAGFPGENLPPQESYWRDVVDAYEAAKAAQNAVVPADLVPLVTRALEDRDFRELVTSQRCRHVLIDGLQDFTPAEYLMAKSLTGEGRSITVTANPNESVRLREGADDRVLGLFRLDYQALQRHTYSLSVNLRMTEVIGDAVNRISADPAMSYLSREQQEFLRIGYVAGDAVLPMASPELLVFDGRPADMYRYIFDQIKDLTDQGHSLAQMACISVDEASIERLRVLALARGMPYTVLGVEPPLRDRDVTCIMGLLTSLLNPKDVIALRNGVRFDSRLERQVLDRDAIIRIERTARERHLNVVDAAGRYADNPLIDEDHRRGITWFLDAREKLDRMLMDRVTRVDEICWRAVSLLEQAQGTATPLRSKAQVAKLLALAEDTAESYRSQFHEYDPRETLRIFLDEVDPGIHTDPLSLETVQPFGYRPGITLSTIAASQGLEWPIVWAVGASDHLLPGNVAAENEQRMRAAQRLFYVWASRARDRLFYCCATRSGPKQDAAPTRFLEPIGDILRYEAVPAPPPRS